jgi:hypothetical protein
MSNHKQFSVYSEEIIKNFPLYESVNLLFSFWGEREEREAGLAFVGGCRFSPTLFLDTKHNTTFSISICL